MVMSLVGYGSLLVESNLLLLVTGMFVGVVFISARTAAAALNGVSVQRMVPDTVVCGDPLRVGYRLSNARRRTVHSIWIHESGVDPSRVRAPDTYVRSIGPQSELLVQQSAESLRRGTIAFDCVELRTRFPFGLVEARYVYSRQQATLALPVLLAVRKSMFRPRDERSGTGDRVERHRCGVDDFLGLRDYRIGDNPRWIHWRRSASTGRLVIREMFPFASAQCTVIVDHRLAGAGSAALSHRERVVSAAASLACHALERGLHVGLIGLARPSVFVPPVGGKAHRAKLLTELAALHDEPECPIEETFARMQRRAMPSTQCVLLSSQRDSQTARLLSALRSRGADVAFLTPDDDGFAAAFGAPPGPRAGAPSVSREDGRVGHVASHSPRQMAHGFVGGGP